MVEVVKGSKSVDLTAVDRQYVLQALDALASIYTRRINTEKNQAIKELLDSDRKAVLALSGRF